MLPSPAKCVRSYPTITLPVEQDAECNNKIFTRRTIIVTVMLLTIVYI